MKQQYPEPVVGALIFKNDGRFFLAKSYKSLHNWVIPGGHIEVGEKLEKALYREVREETGLVIKKHRLIGLQEFVRDTEAFHEKKHFIFIDFVCETDSTEVALNDELQAYRWVTFEETRGMSLDFYTKRLIEGYYDKKTADKKVEVLYNYATKLRGDTI